MFLAMKKLSLISMLILFPSVFVCAQTQRGVEVQSYHVESAQHGDVEVNKKQEALKRKLGAPLPSSYASEEDYLKAKKEWINKNPDKHREILEQGIVPKGAAPK